MRRSELEALAKQIAADVMERKELAQKNWEDSHYVVWGWAFYEPPLRFPQVGKLWSDTEDWHSGTMASAELLCTNGNLYIYHANWGQSSHGTYCNFSIKPMDDEYWQYSGATIDGTRKKLERFRDLHT